ncbi:unnamed protein product [Ceutorhynchus assimilis]|uniref:Cytochrome P450 n=1 Tax=Ceutorhynchus assimilis TaxID=467358 RepID=A0A9N9MR52_9CUCU|nr:unnamed protein product [Ceutorhynchus assimilis]
MMSTDFDYFSSHGLFSHENDLLSDTMFNATGTKWKTLRSKLSPSFSSAKLKTLFGMLYQLGDRFEKKIEDYSKKGETLDMKNLAMCFGTDVVSICLLGLESDCMNYPESDLGTISKLMSEPRPVKFMVENTVNWNLLGTLGYRVWSKRIDNFFLTLIPDALEFRKKNKLSRNDMIGLLIQAQDNDQLTEREVIANIVSIYFAGYETTSTTISFLMYELSKNQEVQDKLRKEIMDLRKLTPDGEFTYDDLVHMKYADKCIYETLRKYPPVPEVPRAAVKDYKIPGTNQVIPKGVLITTPVMSVHYDPEYYPNPEEFNPENFSPENKAARHEFSFLGFGGGPRICIEPHKGLQPNELCRHQQGTKKRLNGGQGRGNSVSVFVENRNENKFNHSIITSVRK